MNKWVAGVYLRLSNDDKDKDESNSITNQREIIKEFIKNNPDIELYDYYIDDGFTGTDFNRPGFKKMNNDIVNERINTVIIKDLSRIGRNYIQVGNFIDDTIPMYNLRFISINDNIDSWKKHASMQSIEIPFKNMMNESYAKDISNKVKSAQIIRKKNGDFIGPTAPYGYKKDEFDNHQLIIDEEAAIVIRRIFDMALKGYSRKKISDILNAESVYSPSKYKKEILGLNITRVADKWNPKILDDILKNEVYIGNMIQGKRSRISHKIHNIIRKPEEEWIKVNDTHDSIIDLNVFKQVNDLLYNRQCYTSSNGKQHTYTGYLVCNDCKHSLSRCTKNDYVYYYCSSYKKNKVCSKHFINEHDLNEIVLETINKYISLICNLDKTVEDIITKDNISYERELAKIKEIDLEKDIRKYRSLINEIVEDYKNDYISKDDFDTYNRKYLYEFNKAKNELEILQNKTNELDLNWLEKVKQNNKLDHIDRNIVSSLIDKIVINEDSSVKIIFKYHNEYEQTIKFLKSHNYVI